MELFGRWDSAVGMEGSGGSNSVSSKRLFFSPKLPDWA